LDPSAELLEQRMNTPPGRVAGGHDQQMGRMTHPTGMWQGFVTCGPSAPVRNRYYGFLRKTRRSPGLEVQMPFVLPVQIELGARPRCGLA